MKTTGTGSCGTLLPRAMPLLASDHTTIMAEVREEKEQALLCVGVWVGAHGSVERREAAVLLCLFA